LAGAVALIALWSRPAPAEDLSSQIAGTWKVKSVECVDSDGKECSTPLSKLTRYYVFSRGGRYFKGSSSGDYAIEGGKVREVSVSGNLMTLKSMPVVSNMARSTVIFTVVAEKVD
jgi:hypothetical protein